jgi:hypothetical protein
VCKNEPKKLAKDRLVFKRAPNLDFKDRPCIKCSHSAYGHVKRVADETNMSMHAVVNEMIEFAAGHVTFEDD